jgi:MFS family permease
MTSVAQPQPKLKQLRRVIFSSFVGTSIEWYDFFLFGSAAALVFPRVFFPNSSPETGILLSFMTYGVAFLARPFGGIFFGRMGDAIGRKRALIVTLFIAGGGTFLIGCIPGYDSIGIWATVLLVLMRLLQGFGLGGEWGGAVTLSAEHADADGRAKARGVLTSAIQLGVPVGNLLAVGALAVMNAVLPEDQFVAWGWRVPFLASAILVVVGLWIRVSVTESPLFEKVEAVKAPLREMLRSSWRQVLLTIGIRIASDVSYYVFAVFALSYIANTLELPPSVGLTGVIVGSLLQLVIIPASAHLSDRIGRRPVYVVGAVAVGVWAIAAWPIMNTGTEVAVVSAIAIGIAAQGIMYGPMAAFIAEMFPTRVRATGASFGYQVAGVLGGALAPLLAQLLLTAFGSTSAVSVYVVITAVIAVVSALLARETRATSLSR